MELKKAKLVKAPVIFGQGIPPVTSFPKGNVTVIDGLPNWQEINIQIILVT